MPESGSETRSGIGARLRAGRERMGLTQLHAAEKLHVDAKVVESLEAERFEALGAPVFVRGHLKHYCELIGEPAHELVELYNAGTQPVPPDLTRLPKAAPEARPGRLAVPALLVLIVFVGIGVVWWVLESVRSSAPSEPIGAREVPVEPVLDTPLPEPAEGLAPEIDATTAGAAAGGAQAASSPATPSPATAASTTAPPAATASSSGAAASATSPATPAAPARARPMEVTLRFASDSWVEVYDADGERLFYDIGSADSQRTISGTPPFRVTFGNAPGVSFDVNGKPATLPENTLRNDTAHFVINRSGRIVRAQAQAEGN